MNTRNSNADMLDEKIIDHSPSIVTETANMNRRVFAANDLALLSVDELWIFRGELDAILTAKMAAEVRELERRIDRLNGVIDTNERAGKSSNPARPTRRPYPAVLPRYRNLEPPFETWSGRGRTPRWLSAQLEFGKRLEDFRIGPG
jgi:DNA-binding protein H-NS